MIEYFTVGLLVILPYTLLRMMGVLMLIFHL